MRRVAGIGSTRAQFAPLVADAVAVVLATNYMVWPRVFGQARVYSEI